MNNQKTMEQIFDNNSNYFTTEVFDCSDYYTECDPMIGMVQVHVLFCDGSVVAYQTSETPNGDSLNLVANKDDIDNFGMFVDIGGDISTVEFAEFVGEKLGVQSMFDEYVNDNFSEDQINGFTL